jgi:hypothetical protein
MKSIKINVGEESYKIIQIRPTLNLYKILHMNGFFEITKDTYNGNWKVLMQNNRNAQLPLAPIGQIIEDRLMVEDEMELQ